MRRSYEQIASLFHPAIPVVTVAGLLIRDVSGTLGRAIAILQLQREFIRIYHITMSTCLSFKDLIDINKPPVD